MNIRSGLGIKLGDGVAYAPLSSAALVMCKFSLYIVSPIVVLTTGFCLGRVKNDDDDDDEKDPLTL